MMRLRIACEDCDKAGVASVVVLFTFTVNQKFSGRNSIDSAHSFGSNSHKSAFVEDHRFSDHAPAAGPQNGLHSPSFIVSTRPATVEGLVVVDGG
jgi:hypothetical protein